MEQPFEVDSLLDDAAKLMQRNMQLVQEVGRYKRLCDEMAELIKIGQAECALRAYKADDLVGRLNRLKAQGDADTRS
jgi:hypothetical protein